MVLLALRWEGVLTPTTEEPTQSQLLPFGAQLDTINRQNARLS